MNRNFKKIACFMATALLLTACAQDEMTDGNTLPEGKYPLQIASVSVVGESTAEPWGAKSVQSRVAESTDGNSSTWEWNNTENIGVRIGDGKPGKYVLASVNTINAVTPCYWASTASSQSVTAWYPAYEGESGTVNLSDQSGGLAYVLTGGGTGDYNKEVTLSFSHALAKVRVVLEGDKKSEVTDVKIKSYISCTNKQGSISTDGASEGWITMMECTRDGATCWEANVVPDHLITEFQVNGTEGTLNNAGITPSAAKVNTIRLTVNERLTPASPITITDDGEYIITGSGDQTITISGGSPKVTLDGVTIENNNTPIRITSGTPTLIIKGQTNLSTTSTEMAAIQLEGAYTHVRIEGSGTLKINSSSGAGIGSGKNGTCGNIYINGITAIIKSRFGAGIGGGDVGNCGNIKIENANITIDKPEGAAAIGCGSPYSINLITKCGDIEIINSDITANVGNYYAARPAAIGCCGAFNDAAKGSCGDITITLKSGQKKDDFLSKLTIFGNVEKVGLGGHDDNLKGKVGIITWKKADGNVIETTSARDI